MDEKRLHNIWRCMVGRCHNANWNNYFARVYYREKGIIVCDEWRYSFENFKTWALQNGYEDNLSIDRIDSDGNYEPSNCRWITYDENRRLGLENARKSRKKNGKRTGNWNDKGRYEVRLAFCPSFTRVEQIGLSYHRAKEIARELTTQGKYEKLGGYYLVFKMDKDSKVGLKRDWEVDNSSRMFH